MNRNILSLPLPLQTNLEDYNIGINSVDTGFLSQKQRLSQLKDNDFELLCELGAGGGGVVTKVKHIPTGLIMAKKKINFQGSEEKRTNIVRELKALDKCDSEHIIGFYGAFYSEGRFNFLMEYMDCGSLDQVLKKVKAIPEKIIGKITIAVMKGLKYLQENHDIIHRDVKPSNILVNSCGAIKICDFGVSRELLNSIQCTYPVGSYAYMSPECFQQLPYQFKSDIWSLGISLLELAIGTYPFQTPNGRRLELFHLYEFIVNKPSPTLPISEFSKEFNDFIDICLKKNPEEREDLNSLMNHEFIKRSEGEDIDFSHWIHSIYL